MLLDETEMDEFIVESEELLDSAEDALLNIENSDDYTPLYNSTFRVFHSLKGAAGMANLTYLQSYMHVVESFFQKKEETGLTNDELTFFLKCVDEARLILRGDTSIPIPTSCGGSTTEAAPTEAAPTEAAPTEAAPTEASEPVNVIPEDDKNSAGTIWLVDDEEDLLDIYSEKFESAGFKTVSFADPLEVLKKLDLYTPDLILSDFKMPQLNGLELLEKVRVKNQSLPFIMCSGFLDKETVIKSLELGLFAAIDKPPTDEQLLFLATNAITQYKSNKLISKLVNFLMFQYSELEASLSKKGDHKKVRALKKDLKDLLQQRAQLKSHSSNITV